MFAEHPLDDADEHAAASTNIDVEKLVELELDRYRLFPATPRMAASPLLFWKDNGCSMPHLALVARHLLSIPPYKASIERLFSAAGRAVTQRRFCPLSFNIIRETNGGVP